MPERHIAAVEDAEHRERRQVGLERPHRLGEKSQVKAHQPVTAHLEKHPSEEDGARRGRLRVRVGQPGVKGKGGEFDKERYRETQAEEERGTFGDPQSGQSCRKHPIVKTHRPAVRGQGGGPEDADEQKDRAEKRVEQKLQCRVAPPLVAPDADNEEHGDEDQLKGDKKEDEVERGESRGERALQEQKEGEEAAL